MTDLNFGDREETEDARWARINAQLDPIMKITVGGEAILLYENLASAVISMLIQNVEWPPTLWCSLWDLQETHVYRPLMELFAELIEEMEEAIASENAPPVIRSEAEIENEGRTRIDERLVMLELRAKVLMGILQVVGGILQTLADGPPLGEA